MALPQKVINTITKSIDDGSGVIVMANYSQRGKMYRWLAETKIKYSIHHIPNNHFDTDDDIDTGDEFIAFLFTNDPIACSLFKHVFNITTKIDFGEEF